jgi:DNA-binding NtrC family response regulator
MSIRILIADDDASLRRVIEVKLRQKGYDVKAVGDGQAALSELSHGVFDLLLSDMKMPNMNGLALLERARKVSPQLQIIMMTAYATVSQAVQAVKLGAFDYLTKPFEDDQLFLAIEKAVRFRKLEDENRTLREQVGDKYLKHFVGASPAFKQLLALIEKVAPSEATILITGESGSGKELAARAIHLQSQCATGPFVPVNCAAIPRELIESELFGHIKGAFTGAIKDKKGKFQLADGGTLFLDEISELGIELQAKLLRALQSRIVEPVGSEIPVEVDVRIVAATNVLLKEKVADGKFREDLFYRLNVIPINVPPLRSRREDIPVLVREFLGKLDVPEVTVAPDLLECLTSYDWPGNVRELENLVERMVVLRKSDQLNSKDLPADFGQVTIGQTHPGSNSASVGQNRTGLVSPAKSLSFDDAQRRVIVEALEKCAWNKTKAAEMLQMPRHILVYRMKQLGITSPSA